MKSSFALVLTALIACGPLDAAAQSAAAPTKPSSAPNISVGALYEYLAPGQSTLLKRIHNSGDATAFVRVNITEILYATDGSHHEIPVDTRGIGQPTASATPVLLASPARLIVPIKGQQGTRLLYQGPREHERYYRVRFIPVAPEKTDDFALSEEEGEQYKAALGAGVQVLTGYGTVLIVRPAETRYDTQLSQAGDTYTVRNNGNSIIVLDSFQDCTDARTCTDARKIHLRPGRSEGIELRQGHRYRFELIEGDSTPRKVEVAG